MDISALPPAELSAHLRQALATPSGQVLREFLRRHCYMAPSVRPEPWENSGQVAFRYGRMTLFQLLEHASTSGEDAPACTIPGDPRKKGRMPHAG
jgi:hypothetical protein